MVHFQDQEYADRQVREMTNSKFRQCGLYYCRDCEAMIRGNIWTVRFPDDVPFEDTHETWFTCQDGHGTRLYDAPFR